MSIADIIAKIQLAPIFSAEANERRAREDHAAKVRDGWLEDARQLPRVPHAKMSNQRWRSGVSQRVLAAVNAWTPTKSGLALYGPTGTGKTTALIAGLRAHAATSHAEVMAGREPKLPRFAWVKELDLLRIEKQHPLGKGPPPELRRLYTVPHLIIDEVGPGYAQPLVLFDVLDKRYDNGHLPTSITCGHTPDVLLARYGDALYRRLGYLSTEVDLFRGGL